jgi:heme exporter protein A
MKILKNLLIYPGSSRRAFGAPQDDGRLGMHTESLVVSRGLSLLSDSLSLSILPGKIYRVLGENGAGKTTLLRLLAGIKSPSKGTVQRTGSLCFIGHPDWQSLDLTVEETLQCWGGIYGSPAQKSIDGFMLESFLNHPIHQLSHGQKQRVALARVLCSNFDLWIMDEPFSNLDGLWVKKIEQIFLDHTQKGGGIIFSEHGATERSFCVESIMLRRPS